MARMDRCCSWQHRQIKPGGVTQSEACPEVGVTGHVRLRQKKEDVEFEETKRSENGKHTRWCGWSSMIKSGDKLNDLFPALILHDLDTEDDESCIASS